MPVTIITGPPGAGKDNRRRSNGQGADSRRARGGRPRSFTGSLPATSLHGCRAPTGRTAPSLRPSHRPQLDSPTLAMKSSWTRYLVLGSCRAGNGPHSSQFPCDTSFFDHPEKRPPTRGEPGRDGRSGGPRTRGQDVRCLRRSRYIRIARCGHNRSGHRRDRVYGGGGHPGGAVRTVLGRTIRHRTVSREVRDRPPALGRRLMLEDWAPPP